VDTRDFRGVTGSVGWNYRPTGKTAFDLRLARDTGTRGNGAPTELDPSVTAAFLTDARLSDRVDAAVRWEATSKITLRGQAGYSHDRFDEQFITGGAAIASGDSGNTRNYLIGVAYQATRAWSLGCEAGRRSRSTPVFIGGVGYSYDADVASCTVQLLLQ
jgi:outer membrane autotransporter barrel domain